MSLTGKKRLQELRDVHAIQGTHGNWNDHPYMLGMFNGLELALAIMEDREPQYREAPDTWLSPDAAAASMGGHPTPGGE